MKIIYWNSSIFSKRLPVIIRGDRLNKTGRWLRFRLLTGRHGYCPNTTCLLLTRICLQFRTIPIEPGFFGACSQALLRRFQKHLISNQLIRHLLRVLRPIEWHGFIVRTSYRKLKIYNGVRINDRSRHFERRQW